MVCGGDFDENMELALGGKLGGATSERVLLVATLGLGSRSHID